MTGTLTAQHIIPTTDNTYDLGSTSFMVRSGYVKTSVVLGQTTANYTFTWANPASARAISIEDPGGTDVFVWKAATQTLTNKTLTAPVLSGTVTGTYTLGGTPTISAPTVTGSISCTGCVTSTNILDATIVDADVNGAAAIGWAKISKSGSSLADLATRTVANLSDGTNVALLNAADTFTVTNTATTALAVRYNGSNSLLGFTIGNANGFVYLGNNTKAQVGSDVPVYDINGAATQLRLDSGALTFNYASAGTAGNPITWTQGYAVSNAGLLTVGTGGGTFGPGGNISVNSAGDLAFGALNHILLSTGVPSRASGFGTSSGVFVGTDTGFHFANGSGANTGGVINFGHTFSSVPSCTMSIYATTTAGYISAISTTQLTVTLSASAGSDVLAFTCNGS